MRLNFLFQMFVSAAVVTAFFVAAPQAGAAPAPTTTAMTITSGGSTASSVTSGSEVTLTAAVVSGSTKVTAGQVNFCDASATYCTDIHLLGTAQLTSAGTAVFNFHPGIGSHSYKAVFAATPNGTPAYAASTSSTASLAVTGTFPTTTAIAASGSAGNYTLTATVTGNINASGVVAPAGTVSFLDTSTTNAPLGTAPLGAGTEALSFLNFGNPPTGSDPSVGTFPNGVWVADFNGDGIPDLAFANLLNSVVTILLGKGDGTFTAAPYSPYFCSCNASSNDISVAVGDFNGDGIPDLAVSNQGSSVTILLGKGDGTFTESSSYTPKFSDPTNAAVGDFNSDGNSDLAVTISDSDYVAILLGNGSGGFTVSGIPAGQYPVSIVVGDFNGDGIPDLAVGGGQNADTLTILLGNGDGSFTAAKNSPITMSVGTFDNPDGIRLGDFNGDGKMDLAVAGGGNPAVTILLGNGNGTFSNATNSPVTLNSTALALSVGDFNGDGIADLAVVVGSTPGTMAILLGNGNGTFTQLASGPVPTGELGGAFLAVGDFNGDGLTDISVLSEAEASASVLLSQLTETATATATGISPLGTGTQQVDASYPGNSLYGASVSATTGLTAVTPPSFAITGAAVTVAPGATTGNTSTITITPAGGFTGSVALTASITASPTSAVYPPTLSFGATTPASITGSAAGSATLTITTTASTSGTCTSSNQTPREFPWYAGGGAVLACVFLFGIPARRRRWQSMLGMLLLLVAFVGGLMACGSGGGGIACPALSTSGTTAGTYTVTVTGASNALTETGTVTLTVQ